MSVPAKEIGDGQFGVDRQHPGEFGARRVEMAEMGIGGDFDPDGCDHARLAVQGVVSPFDRLFEAPRGEMSGNDTSGVEKAIRIGRAQTARPFDGFDRRVGLVSPCVDIPSDQPGMSRIGVERQGAIEPKLRQTEIERASRKPAADLTAYDLYLRALAQSYRFTDEGVAEAVVLARRALTIDPSYAPAAALIGWCRVIQRAHGWGALSQEDIAEACRLARQALEAGRDDAETIGQAARTLFYLAGEAAMAAAALDRALARNPNAARAWSARGIIHAMRNEPEPAIAAVERARRLSPFDPHAFGYAANIAVAHLVARRFEQAIEWADRALHDQPRTVAGMRPKVVALAHLGRLDEARAELSRTLAIDPKLTIAGYRARSHFMAPEVLELYVSGLRLAGLPEK